MKNSPLASQQNKQEKASTTSNPAASTAVAPSGLLLSTAMIQRAQQDPRALSSQDVLALQRTIGNRAVANLIQSKGRNVPTLQPKLQVGPAHDPYEAEADHIANQVVQRQPEATHEPIHHVQPQRVSGKNAKRSPMIQRFNDDDAKPGGRPNWGGETTEIKKSSSGSVTGVFFVTGQGGKPLVIKPEYKDGEIEGRPITAGQSQFSDMALSKLGFVVPNSRIVWPNDEEFQEIVQILNSQLLILKPQDDEQRGAIVNRLSEAKYFKIMSSVEGESWEDKTYKAALSLENTKQFLAFLEAGNYAVARNMGKLIVADAALGNDDRISYMKHFKRMAMNAGNAMFVGNQMVLIDNDATIGELSTGMGSMEGPLKTKLVTYDLVNTIFDHKEQYAASFAEKHILDQLHIEGRGRGIREKTIGEGYEVKPHYEEWLNVHKDGMKGAFIAGMESGLQQIKLLLSNKDNMNELREETRSYGKVEGEGQSKQLWSTFKTRARYMEARSGGKDKEETAYENQFYFHSKMGYTPQPEGIDPDALNIEAPDKRSKRKKFSLARRFGKRDKSRKQKKQARRLMHNQEELDKLDILNTSGQVVPKNLAPQALLNQDTFKTNKRKDRGAREVNFLRNTGVLTLELQKKGAEIRNQYKYLQAISRYLDMKNRDMGETTTARQRFNSYVAAGTLDKLEAQTQQLEAAVDRALPGLTRYNPALVQKLQTYVTALRRAMDELALMYQHTWDVVTGMEYGL